MNLSQFQQAVWHGRGSDAGPGQAWDHGREIVAPVEAVFKLGKVSWYVLARRTLMDRWVPVMAALMLPRAVLTHLKAGVFAAFGPEPVLTITWLHPAHVTAAKQARPSLMTAQAGSRPCSAKVAIEAPRKPVTRRSFRVTARLLPRPVFLDAGDDVGIGYEVLEKAAPCIG